MTNKQQHQTPSTSEQPQQSGTTPKDKVTKPADQPPASKTNTIEQSYSKETNDAEKRMERKARQKSRPFSGIKMPSLFGHRSRNASGRTDASEKEHLRFSYHDYSYYGAQHESDTFGSAGGIPDNDFGSYHNNYDAV